MDKPHTPLTADDRSIFQKYSAALRFFYIIIAGIFVAEVIAMIVIYLLSPNPYWVETLLDATIMTVLIFPILYTFSYRPLLLEVNERRRSEALLAEVLEILPVGVWITDPNGVIIRGNAVTQQIWAGARYVGIDHYGEYKCWWLDSGKRIQPEEWASARAIRHGETSLNEEIEIECFDGKHKIILNSAIPIIEEGAIQGAILVNQDITERKRYEQELIHSNELIERAFNTVDTLIAYMDRDFNFIRVNETYAQAGGHPKEYFIGKNHFDLYPHPENQAIFQQVVDTGEPVFIFEKPFEYAEYPERGVTYWNWGLQPVKGANGSAQGLVLSLLDVTERKRAQLQLERQNQELLTLSITERKQRELSESLLQSMQALNTSLDLEEVLNKILQQIQRTISFRRANIVLLEDGALREIHSLGPEGFAGDIDPREKPYLLNDLPRFLNIHATQLPDLIEDTLNSPNREVLPGMEWLRSYVAAPMILGGRVTGIISLASDQPGAYDKEIVERLMAFAAPAAAAIENARLFTAELRARQVAEALTVISRALTQTLDLETVMNTLLDHMCQLIPYDHAYIAIAVSETQLAVRAAYGYESEESLKRELNTAFDEWDIPYLREVISTRKSLLIPDTKKYPGWTSVLTPLAVRNWLGIPMLANDKVLGILAMAHTNPKLFNDEHIRLAEGIAGQASVAIQNAWLFEQVRAGHERLQSLSRRLVEVQESERRYIARELHDEAGQTLTALKFGLRLLEQEAGRQEDLRPRVAELIGLSDGILENLHRLAMDLRPASLDHLGLVAALEQLVKDAQERFKINVRFKAAGFSGAGRLPDYVETNLYRIVQEALTNAVRHASASSVDVILELRDNKAVAIVEDDGMGFDIAQIDKSGHLGLLGMEERAQMMGGALQIESRSGRGTTIVVEVPYANSNLDR